MPAQTNTGLSLPTQQQRLVYSDDGGLLLTTVEWYRFFQGLFNRTQATVPALVGTGLSAAGTTQATALKLTAEWNEITTVAANTGVLLNNFGVGFDNRVFNKGANILKIYPPIGCQIDALGANAAYSLAAGKTQVFSQLTATQFYSLQLG